MQRSRFHPALADPGRANTHDRAWAWPTRGRYYQLPAGPAVERPRPPAPGARPFATVRSGRSSPASPPTSRPTCTGFQLPRAYRYVTIVADKNPARHDRRSGPDITMPLPAFPGAMPRPRAPGQPAGPAWAPATVWRHSDLLGNASSPGRHHRCGLAAGFRATGRWPPAFSPGSVGYGAAGISAMTLLGTVGMLGWAPCSSANSPAPGRARLVSAALLASASGPHCWGTVRHRSPHFSVHFGHMSGNLGQAALFTAGAS